MVIASNSSPVIEISDYASPRIIGERVPPAEFKSIRDRRVRSQDLGCQVIITAPSRCLLTFLTNISSPQSTSLKGDREREGVKTRRHSGIMNTQHHPRRPSRHRTVQDSTKKTTSIQRNSFSSHHLSPQQQQLSLAPAPAPGLAAAPAVFVAGSVAVLAPIATRLSTHQSKFFS
jgi:hypothetical protein